MEELNMNEINKDIEESINSSKKFKILSFNPSDKKELTKNENIVNKIIELSPGNVIYTFHSEERTENSCNPIITIVIEYYTTDAYHLIIDGYLKNVEE